MFFPFSNKTSKFSGSCNNINCPRMQKFLGLMFLIINNVGIKINADVNAKK